MDNTLSFLDQQRDNMISTLQTLVKIPSKKDAAQENAPFGPECARALQETLSIAESMGFEANNLDNYIGYVDYGSGDTTFGILVHLDVVPEGNGWDYNPYGGEISGGRMYGRGTSDDKGPAVAALYALLAIKESGLALNRKVRLIFGCDEESGWEDIDYYKKFEKLPDLAISPDGEYPVVNSEKGILSLSLTKNYGQNDNPQAYVHSIKAGTVSNVVPGECIAQVQGVSLAIVENEVAVLIKYSGVSIDCEELEDGGIKIHVIGKSAHASTPEEGVNAISVMLDLLTRLPLDDSEAFRELTNLSNLFPMNDFQGKALNIDSEDEKSGKLTCNLALISFGTKGLSVTLDIRHPASDDPQNIIAKLSDATGAKASNIHQKAPHYVDPESELVQSLLKVYEECTGQEGYCISIGGGTYARAIENAVTFGCEFPGTEMLAHQPNESISLDELLLNAKLSLIHI